MSVLKPNCDRPAEVELLVGDESKAGGQLGLSTSVSLEILCAMLGIADTHRNTNATS